MIYGMRPKVRRDQNNWDYSRDHFAIADTEFYKIGSKRFLEVRDEVYPITKMENGEMMPFSSLGKKMFEYYYDNFYKDNNENYPSYDINTWHK